MAFGQRFWSVVGEDDFLKHAHGLTAGEFFDKYSSKNMFLREKQGNVFFDKFCKLVAEQTSPNIHYDVLVGWTKHFWANGVFQYFPNLVHS